MKFFMAALSHQNDLSKDLEGYLDPSAAYIVAKEVANDGKHKETEGQHFHIAAEMNDKQYDSFRNTILKNKYNLRGKACKGLPRQYGVVKDVRNETKFLAYTCKDKNIIYRNIDLKTIKYYISESYKKETMFSKYDGLMLHLKSLSSDFCLYYVHEKSENPRLCLWNIKLEVTKYWMKQGFDKALSKSQLTHYTNSFLQLHWKRRMEHIEDIVSAIDNPSYVR